MSKAACIKELLNGGRQAIADRLHAVLLSADVEAALGDKRRDELLEQMIEIDLVSMRGGSCPHSYTSIAKELIEAGVLDDRALYW